MKEKLIIQNFGPLKSVELELGEITVLMGAQASGKSTIAKLLSVCRYLPFVLDENDERFKEGLNNCGLSEFLNNKSYIYYECERYGFTKDVVKGTQEISAKTAEMEYLIKKSKEANIHSDNFRYFQFKEEISEIMDNPFYFPTERGLQSIFSLGQPSISNMSNSLFNYFAEIDSISRKFVEETYIEPLDIFYINRNGHGYIKGKNDRDYIHISSAANGFQSTVPVVLAVKYFSEIKKKPKTFIVEEPELNLFPEAQKKLIEYIVEINRKFKHSFLITTHSVYTLTSLDTMMYAYKIGTMNDGKSKAEIAEIKEEKYWINPEDVSSYYLENGTAKDSLDREEALFNKDYVDNVSEIIGETIDSLLCIEVQNSEI